MRRLFHIAARVIAILAIILAVLVALTGSSWFRRTLARHIQSNLEDATGGKVEITQLAFSPLDLRVSMQRLTIRGGEKASEPPLFSARGLIARVSPASLLHWQLILSSLEWQRADIHLLTHPDGSTNLPGSKSSSAADSSLMNLRIRRLALNGTSVYWNDQIYPFELAARNVEILLRLRPGGRYQGTLASSGLALKSRYGTSPQITFAASFEAASNQVEVSSLSWQINNLRGSASGVAGWKPALNGRFDFRTSGGLGDLAQALHFTPVRKGYLYLDGKGVYGDGGLTVHGRVRVRDLAATAYQFDPGTLNFSSDYEFENREIKLSNFVLAVMGGRAEGDVAASLQNSVPRLVLHSRLSGLSLSQMAERIPDASGTIGIFHLWSSIGGVANAEWDGSSKKMQGQFDFQFSPPTQIPPGSIPLQGHAQGSFTLARGMEIILKNSTVHEPHSTITADGTYNTNGSALNLKIVTTDFEEWRPLAKALIETSKPLALTLRGPAVFIGKVAGTLANPEIVGHLSATAFDSGGARWDGFQADVQAAPNRVKISAGKLQLQSSTVTLNADVGLSHWEFNDQSDVQLDAAMQAIPVGAVRELLGLKLPMEGSLTGHLQMSGHSGSLSGEGQVAIRKGKLEGVPFDLLSAELHTAGSAWEFNNIKMLEGRGSATGLLHFDTARRSFTAKLHGRDFELAQFLPFAQKKAEAKSPQVVSGLLNFDVNGGGTFESSQAQSTLDVRELAWNGYPLGTLHGTANWSGNQIELRIDSEGALGKVHCDGAIQTQKEWPIHLTGQFTDFRVNPWMALFSSHTMGAQISASGSFTVDGQARQTQTFAGSSQIQSLQLSFPDLVMKNDSPILLQYASRRLTINRFRMQGPATNFEVGGSIQFSHQAALDITANGEAAATLLSLIAGDVQATGKSNLEVHVGGTLARPQLTGSVKVSNVGIGYDDFPLRLSGMSGEITLDGDRATISSLTGSIGGGKVRLSGYASLQNALNYDLRTEFSQVRIRYPSDFTTVLDASLSLAGNGRQGLLSGDVAVSNIYASQNLNLIDLMGESATTLPILSSGVTSPLLSKINLGVHITSPRSVNLESHDLRIVADIDVRIQGTMANPVAVGGVHLRNGQAVFRGNRYTVTRGEISLTNPFQTEPVLDIEAQTHIDTYDLTLIISGSPDHIRFAFRSDPPLPTEDILSLLAFGYSKQSTQFTQTGRTASFSSAGASALLSQALSSQVTGRISRIFGVSRIQYTPYSTEPGALGGPVLTVEQQLSRQLLLTYQTGTANSQYRVIQFDWTVSQRMSVRGFRDQNGIFGVEIRFRRRFR